MNHLDTKSMTKEAVEQIRKDVQDMYGSVTVQLYKLATHAIRNLSSEFIEELFSRIDHGIIDHPGIVFNYTVSNTGTQDSYEFTIEYGIKDFTSTVVVRR